MTTLLITNADAELVGTYATSSTTPTVISYHPVGPGPTVLLVHQDVDVTVSVSTAKEKFRSRASVHDIFPEVLVLERSEPVELRLEQLERGDPDGTVRLEALTDEAIPVPITVYRALAEAQRNLGAPAAQTEAAASALERALTLCLRCTPLEKDGLRLRHGVVAATLGQNKIAVSSLGAVHREAEPELRAVAASYLGQQAYRDNKFDAARSYLQYAATHHTRVGWRASAINYQGLVEYAAADFELAADLISQALLIYQDAGYPGRVANQQNNLAAIYYATGQFDAARQTYLQALDTHLETASTKDQATVLGNLAELSRIEGDYDSVLADYLRVEKLYEQVGDTRGLARTLHRIGTAYAELGNFSAAESFLLRAEAERERLSDRRPLSRTLTALGELAQVRGEVASAAELFDRALQATDPSDVLAQADLRLSLAELGAHAGDRAELLAAAALAVDRLRQSMPDGYELGLAALRLAALRLREPESKTLLSEALRAGNATGARSLLLRARALLASRLLLNGETEEAGAAFAAVQEEHDRIRASVRGVKLRASFDATMQGLVDSYVDALLRQPSSRHIEEALLVSERHKARGLRELAQRGHSRSLEAEAWQSRLNALTSVLISTSDSRLRRELLEKIDATITQLDALNELPSRGPVRDQRNYRELQSGLGPNDVVLAFHVGQRATHLWTVTDSAIKYRALPPGGELAPGIKRLHELLSIPHFGPEPPELQQLLTQFSELVFGDGVSPSTRVVYVVPHGIIHDLPIEYLPVAGAGTSRRPVETVIWPTLIPSPARLKRDVSGVLVIADPMFSSEAIEGAGRARLELVQLPGTRAEALAVQKSSRERVKLLLGENATRKQFRESQPGTYRELYIATHAVINEERPELSTLVLSGSGAESQLTFGDVLGLDLAAERVVLSACKTAQGVAYSGEGMMSLAYAFLAAGARSVVANRWPVQDQIAWQRRSIHSAVTVQIRHRNPKQR